MYHLDQGQTASAGKGLWIPPCRLHGLCSCSAQAASEPVQLSSKKILLTEIASGWVWPVGQSLLTPDPDQTITIWMRKMSIRTMAKKLKSTVCGNSWNDSTQHLPSLLHTAAFLTTLNLHALTQGLTGQRFTQTRKGLHWHFQAVHP